MFKKIIIILKFKGNFARDKKSVKILFVLAFPFHLNLFIIFLDKTPTDGPGHFIYIV